jgi:hypothetical protein
MANNSFEMLEVKGPKYLEGLAPESCDTSAVGYRLNATSLSVRIQNHFKKCSQKSAVFKL